MGKPNIDKFGRDYDQLLRRQAEELAHWKLVLKPNVYEALASWCEMTNGPAEERDANYRGPYKAGGLHSCPISQELHHFVMGFQRKNKSFIKVEVVEPDSSLL